MSRRTDLFALLKRTMRAHPEWTDEQVAEYADVRAPEMDILREARRDVGAGDASYLGGTLKDGFSRTQSPKGSG